MVINHLAMTLNEVDHPCNVYTLYPGSPTTFRICWFKNHRSLPSLKYIYIERVIILEEDHLVLHLEFQGIVFPYLSYQPPSDFFNHSKLGHQADTRGGLAEYLTTHGRNVSLFESSVENSGRVNMLKK